MAGRSPGLILQFIPVTFLKANAEQTQEQEQEQEQEQGHRPLRQVRVAQEQEQEQRSEGSVPENRCSRIRRGMPGAGADAEVRRGLLEDPMRQWQEQEQEQEHGQKQKGQRQ